MGGTAFYSNNTIAINSALVDSENLKGEFCITLIHEYAHLVAHALYREKGHGKSWRFCMNMLDLPPNIYHSNTGEFKAVREAQGKAALDDLLNDVL